MFRITSRQSDFMIIFRKMKVRVVDQLLVWVTILMYRLGGLCIRVRSVVSLQLALERYGVMMMVMGLSSSNFSAFDVAVEAIR